MQNQCDTPCHGLDEVALVIERVRAKAKRGHVSIILRVIIGTLECPVIHNPSEGRAQIPLHLLYSYLEALGFLRRFGTERNSKGLMVWQ